MVSLTSLAGSLCTESIAVSVAEQFSGLALDICDAVTPLLVDAPIILAERLWRIIPRGFSSLGDWSGSWWRRAIEGANCVLSGG